VNLTEWQSLLEASFSRLLTSQRFGVGERPVFALEHGLTGPQLEDLNAAVRDVSGTENPSDAHWLPWIVYASELGYRYEGDEYWQTFEEETPGWTGGDNRYWLRKCFLRFHAECHGVQPTGVWAGHFSIICWPITHAILPRDLQYQLAKVLYRVQHLFDYEVLESPERLGQLVASFSGSATSRFRNFVQDPALVGRIVRALLFRRDKDTEQLVASDTLDRIVGDLQRNREAHAWLDEATGSANRTRITGLQRRPGASAPAGSLRDVVSGLGIEPQLVLRPNNEGSWDVLLRIPDLSPLGARFPEVAEVLRSSRCRVAGFAGSPLARQRVLCGAQVRLDRWPEPTEALLAFDHSCTLLDRLLRTECLLPPGPMWLFRVASDGQAYLARTLLVRPGGRYVVLRAAPASPATGITSPVNVSCRGIHADLLRLPVPCTREAVGELISVGLSLVKGVQFRPLGVPPRAWDGEGHGEWLSTQQPCIAVVFDHRTDGYNLVLDDVFERPLAVAPDDESSMTILRLPTLSPGLHSLRVWRRAAPREQPAEVGRLELAIHAPRSWAVLAHDQGPLIPSVDPPSPSLEDLWEGRAQVDIYGPRGRSLHAMLRLYARGDPAPLIEHALPQLSLPLEAATWHSLFESSVKRRREVQDAYDLAKACDVRFDLAPKKWTPC